MSLPRASLVSVDPSGLAVVTTSNVQAALAELDAAVGGAGSLTVQDENGNVATGVTQLDFQGAGVGATSGTGEVVVTIGGGGSGFNPSPVDDPANWSADLGYDQEFSGSGSTPPSGWAWLNQGSGTYSESFGAGVIDHPGQSGNDVKAIIRALPSESVWTATAKVVLTAQRTNYVSAGIVIHDSTSGELILFGFRGDSGAGAQSVNADDYTNATTFGAARLTITDTMGTPTYFRVKRNSSTSWDFLWSNDGIAWRTLAAANNISTFLTPSHIGFGLLRNGTSQALASCHWFRVR